MIFPAPTIPYVIMLWLNCIQPSCTRPSSGRRQWAAAPWWPGTASPLPPACCTEPAGSAVSPRPSSRSSSPRSPARPACFTSRSHRTLTPSFLDSWILIVIGLNESLLTTSPLHSTWWAASPYSAASSRCFSRRHSGPSCQKPCRTWRRSRRTENRSGNVSTHAQDSSRTSTKKTCYRSTYCLLI